MYPNQEVVNAAIAQAQQSSFKFRVGAVVYDGKTILGRGFNESVRTHPKSPHPFKVRHAEFNAILHATVNSMSWNYKAPVVDWMSVYVHRLKKDDSPGLAKPCQWCQGMLDQLGITKIYWSEG